MPNPLLAQDPAVLERKAVIDYILAVHKDDDLERKKVNLVMWGMVAYFVSKGARPAGTMPALASKLYGIHFSDGGWWRFIDDLRQPVGGDPRVAAFLKLLIADEGLMRETLASTGDLQRVARLAADRGIQLTPDELRRFLGPFQTLSVFLRELLRAGVMREDQWQAITGFASSEYSVYGDRHIDEEIFGAVRMASKVLKMLPSLGDLAMPIGVITGPWAAMVIHGIDGGTFSGAELARMFEQSFMAMLEGMLSGLEALAEMTNPFGW